MALQRGARLGPYEIISVIGIGGMGEVYRCRDTRFRRRTVAVKVLLPALAADADFRKRFDREAHIIAQLEHQHLCSLYDIGEHEGRSFIVMPLLDGQSLADRIDSGPVPITEALKIGVAIGSALAYAHEHRVLHRDVKPRNVMLGTDDSVKLVDFGVAKAHEHESSDTTVPTTLTHDGMIGTLEYMSPEQLAGRPLDTRTDMFSLAVVLYEMIAGRHPFRAENRALTACAILKCQYEALPGRDPLTQAVDAVLEKAMAHDPVDRYATMADFLRDLEFVQRAGKGDEPQPWPWRRRTVAAAVGGAVLAAALLMFGPVFTEQPVPGSAHGADAGSAERIAPDEFVKARPGSEGALGPIGSYRRVTATRVGAVENVTEVGVTVWRLRPARSQDTARLLVHEVGSDATEWTPERVELGTPLAVGDRVRISVESPRPGYLYVINRERYADGSTGDPFLIFPTAHTRGGDNRLAAGRLIDVPTQTDRPPYFTLHASRADQTAEMLTLIIADEPLKEVVPGERPLRLATKFVASLEKRGTPSVLERLEMIGGAGRAWSHEEQQAAADTTRLLTQGDPAPQTILRVVMNEPGFLIAQVTLSHERKE